MGRGPVSREMVNHLGKEAQGENKARRKCTCQTEQQQQQLASRSSSYVIALWSADFQVRTENRESYAKVLQLQLLLSFNNTHCGSFTL